MKPLGSLHDAPETLATATKVRADRHSVLFNLNMRHFPANYPRLMRQQLRRVTDFAPKSVMLSIQHRHFLATESVSDFE